MHQIQQRRQTAQFLFAVLIVSRASANGRPIIAGGAVGSDEGSRSVRVLLEVSLEFLTRDVERFALFGRVGREGYTWCHRGHRTRESNRVVHITTNEDDGG
jgi:hypothetical protein